MKNAAEFAAALLVVASPLAGQEVEDPSRWSIGLQAGVAAPITEIEGDGLGTGFGFEGNLAYRVAPHLSLYAGWDWHRFAPESLLGQSDVDVEETGYVLGVSWIWGTER